jgi:hypothetical protein
MIRVKTYDKTLVTVRGQQNVKVSVQNPVQRVRVVQSVSPIPLSSGESPVIDGGNF